MKVVILAGGFGTRISEESHLKPKPMVEIGERPILWHIMKIYSHHGFNEFVICLGYKGYYIKEYFAHYALHGSNVTFDFTRSGQQEQMITLDRAVEPWRVTLVDTGVETLTGGRVKRIRPYVGDETFLLTYGDGLADIDIGQLVAYHRRKGCLATVTAVQLAGRFGSLDIDAESRVAGFNEKPRGDGLWTNGGFFVMEPGVFDCIPGDQTMLEKEPMQCLSAGGQLAAFHHHGFWHPMDTLRDRNRLEELWQSGEAPWKVW